MINIKLKFLAVIIFILAFQALIFAQITIDGKQININRQKSAALKESQDMKFEGTVVLRVTFLASGQVGDVEIISGLRDEVNQQAIAAVRKMEFEPAKKDGTAVSVTKKSRIYFFYIL